MRFIHTADWHLGSQMHDIDRKDETKAFLHWLKNTIIEKNADTLIVAGDIFDTANPGVEARKAYYTFLASLAESCCKNVIITGGNHDSAAMLESSKELLDVLNIRVVGSVTALSPKDMCFELKNENDEACGIAMAVPFVRELELRNYLLASTTLSGRTSVSDGELYPVALKKLYSDVFEAAEKLRSGRKIPVLATGHLYAADLEEKVSKKDCDDGTKLIDVRGTLGNVPSGVFPPADYVALGHIHYSVGVAKNPSIRYSGSPFVMGFDEAERPHYVLFGEVEKSSEKESDSLKIEKIETPRTFLYKRISGTLEEVKVQLEKMQSESETRPKFIEVSYLRENGLNAQEFLEDTIRALPQNYHVASWKVQDAEKFFSENSEGFESTELKNLDEETVFRQLILAKSGLSAESEEGKAALEKFLPLFMQIAGEQE